MPLQLDFLEGLPGVGGDLVPAKQHVVFEALAQFLYIDRVPHRLVQKNDVCGGEMSQGICNTHHVGGEGKKRFFVVMGDGNVLVVYLSSVG